ncbi:SpoVR family protein [Clostridium sp. 19966]|uniref:SpoVR family protein n=1 Tax=Clostridium sp. 19966 TaxID=2768166 RepID=UPI0028E3133C|nr:SpoVR family protein [Clostridium sp. 19966]
MNSLQHEYGFKDLERWNETIEAIAKDMGLDYYDQEFEMVSYKDMLANEAYLGMPSRYPHWSFGKAYEKNSTIYKYNLTGLPYEMVINSDPCIAYLMQENTLLLQILTMAHVYGHNDFFKNNRMFKERTKADYTVEMFKTHSQIVRGYINDPSIGYENVERVLDSAHAIKLQISRVADKNRLDDNVLRNRIIEKYAKENENYDILGQKKKTELPDLNKIPLEPEEDILYFIIKYGELMDWEKNLLQIVRKETEYFIPQIETKIMNEGWASFFHYNILKKLNLEEGLYFEFVKRHNDVIAPGFGSINPYFIGFKMLEDIERRYGREKLFEVRALERDESFIRKYLTQELCYELNLFQYANDKGSYVIKEVSDEEGWKNIRNTLSSSCGMGSIPVIRIMDMSKKDGTLYMEHVYDGRELNMDYAKATLKHVFKLWGHNVILRTKQSEKNVELSCENGDRVTIK